MIEVFGWVMFAVAMLMLVVVVVLMVMVVVKGHQERTARELRWEKERQHYEAESERVRREGK